jgi:LPXTG-motif cell wall-anchored protein
MFSDPTYLGALTVGTDGNFAGNLDLGNVALGEHTLQANGTSFDGAERSANIGVAVSYGAKELPKTGNSGPGIIFVAFLALLGGVILQARSRKSSTR